QTSDPRLRTYLINSLGPLKINPQAIVRRLANEKDDSVKMALILCLGDFPDESLSVEERSPLVERLLRSFCDDSNAGVHSAAEWLLRRWKNGSKLLELNKELTSRDV